MNAIEIRNLSKSFRGMYAVDHLNMMVSMITPLGSTIINVVLCAVGGALFAFGLGAISKVVLKKASLV